jgi:lysozyme family protein
MTVVNFWLGSSAGSQNKDAAAINMQRTQSENTNAAIGALGKKAAAPVIIPTPPVASAPSTAWPPTRTAAQPSNDANASQRFEACMPYIFRMEGGYSDVQGDRGGPTNFGITLEALKEWESNASLTANDVKALTQEQAKEIYRANYWNKMQCGALPDGLDLEVFDFGVNAGPSKAVKTLQRIVGATEDGSTGPITLAAVKTFRPEDLVERYTAARLDYYKSLTGEVQFLAEWESRVSQVQTAALKMAAAPLQMAA